MKTIEITEEQAKEMFDSGIPSLKSIAESTYPNLFKKKIEWKDFGDVKGSYVGSTSFIDFSSSPSFLTNKNVFPTNDEAKACLALSQLCQWRDKYNIGWKPNWEKDYKKYSLMYMKGFIIGSESPWVQSVLSFKSASIRDKFLEDFSELIEEAKFLL